MKVLGIIPARYDSSRFPGKPLADILGKSMIQRVYEECVKAKTLSRVIVATDDQRIFEEVIKFKGEVILTRKDHLNGTSRCAEVLNILRNCENESPYDYIINIQGDEPMMHPEQIDELCSLFDGSEVPIFTQARKETQMLLAENPNLVKVLWDEQHLAIDFTRNIPHSSDILHWYKHIGIYGFKADILNTLVSLQPSENEMNRKLEQMRWMDNGFKIKVGITEYESLSVDTPADLQNVVHLMTDKQT